MIVPAFLLSSANAGKCRRPSIGPLVLLVSKTLLDAPLFPFAALSVAGSGIITYLLIIDPWPRLQPDGTATGTKGKMTSKHAPSAETVPSERMPVLIGVDWGTSSCRACLMDGSDRIVDAVSTGKGILQVEDGAFAETLDDLIGAWRRPGLPVILSGMIGSRQGWIEAPYLPVPATFDEIAAALLRHPDDDDVYVAPGLAQDLPGHVPDVMRGEETQIIGTVGRASDRRLLVMPGTHCKWVLVEDRKIVWFATFMTGELFAVLKDHSILGRLMAPDDGERGGRAFEQGLDAAKGLPGNLLRHLFSARTLALFERVPEKGIAAYLSGLLIGHEIDDALGDLKTSPDDLPPITVIGASALSNRYIDALHHTGLKAENAGENRAAHGQSQLARAANLLAPPTERSA